MSLGRLCIDKRSYEVELPQGLLRRNRVELRKSNEAPIKVEDDDVIEAREQSSAETREDTREQAPPDTRVETFDQPRDPLSSSPGLFLETRLCCNIRELKQQPF